VPYQSITLAQLRTRLADLYEAVPFWDTTDANDAINEALREWSALTGRWRQRVLLQTTPNDYEYALPDLLLYRMRVEWNRQPLSPSSREDLNNGRPNWRQETTASGGSVPSRPLLWAPVSLRTIYIWPADAPGHNSLTLDGVAQTPVLTADAQFVDLSEADVSVLIGYALHVLTFKKGSVFFAGTFGYWRAFLAAAAEENALLLTSAIYRKAMGYDDRTLKPIGAAVDPIGPSIPAETT
jgi:hypothetical protein